MEEDSVYGASVFPYLGLPTLVVRVWALGQGVNPYLRMPGGLCMGLLAWVLFQAVNEHPRVSLEGSWERIPLQSVRDFLRVFNLCH